MPCLSERAFYCRWTRPAWVGATLWASGRWAITIGHVCICAFADYRFIGLASCGSAFTTSMSVELYVGIQVFCRAILAHVGVGQHCFMWGGSEKVAR